MRILTKQLPLLRRHSCALFTSTVSNLRGIEKVLKNCGNTRRETFEDQSIPISALQRDSPVLDVQKVFSFIYQMRVMNLAEMP